MLDIVPAAASKELGLPSGTLSCWAAVAASMSMRGGTGGHRPRHRRCPSRHRRAHPTDPSPATTDAAPAAEAAAPAAPAAPQVAYQTYKAGGGRYKIQFVSDTKAKATWRNMSGSAVQISYTQNGAELDLDWGEPPNTGKRRSKMKVLDECQLVQTWWLDSDGVEHADDPLMYTKDDPRCKR